MRALPAVTTATVVLAASAALAAPGVPATVTSDPARVRQTTVRVLTPSLRELPALTARWTTAGGNGNEVLLSAARDGLLHEFGGSEPLESADGLHWSRVALLTPSPLGAGEGDVVAAPGHRVYGAVWNPYGGDHLQAVTYDPALRTWQSFEVPVHTGLFDRPWLTYAKGPFTVAGRQVGFVTLLHGNTVLPGGDLLSTDGSTYLPTSPARDVASRPAAALRIPVVPDGDADYWQPHPDAHTVPLSGGGLLLLDNPQEQLGCPVAQLEPTTGSWRCVQLPFVPKGALRQDSRGWLTMAWPDGPGFVLAQSTDGGVHWRSVSLPAPTALRPGDAQGWDVKVSGRLGRAVVAWRLYDQQGRGQDVVWDVDVSRAQPRLRRLLLVGKGDHATASAADATSAADRFDLSSVALLPSGQIAVSFEDSSTPGDSYGDSPTALGHSPAVALLER